MLKKDGPCQKDYLQSLTDIAHQAVFNSSVFSDKLDYHRVKNQSIEEKWNK